MCKVCSRIPGNNQDSVEFCLELRINKLLHWKEPTGLLLLVCVINVAGLDFQINQKLSVVILCVGVRGVVVLGTWLVFGGLRRRPLKL